MIAQLASARGVKIEHALLSIGGASLRTHWNKGEARTAIERGTLRLIVGTAKIDRLSKVVSKPTALLVTFLHSVGDYGQHQGGEIRGSFGTSVCHSAVELCEALTIDLKSNQKS